MVDTGLKGKVAFVTGANHGVGAATALAFAREGADIFLTYLSISAPEKRAIGKAASDIGDKPGPVHYYRILERGAEDAVAAIRAVGGRCVAREADLADPENAARLMDEAEREFGKVDVLVNNADHDRPDSFLPAGELPEAGLVGGEYAVRTFTAASHDEHFAVNSRGAALLVAEFARRLIGRRAGWGRIINVSTDGASGHGWSVSYGASKLAAESYAKAAAAELGPYGITVNVVSPGAIQTGWLPEEAAAAIAQTYPLRRIGTPEDIAAAIVFFASAQADWITGQVLFVGGGHRMSP